MATAFAIKTTSLTIPSIWEIYTYDVWGNSEDGYWVNDRCKVNRRYEMKIPITLYNFKTEHQFSGASPTDHQLCEALGLDSISISIEGDDLHFYVNSESGYPLGELICVSHKSLSPIERDKEWWEKCGE